MQDLPMAHAIDMKIVLFFILLDLTFGGYSRTKRTAYDLPAGAELIVGPIRTSFVCRNDGYFADEDNNCKIFHVCHTVKTHNSAKMLQWSFFCGNLTIFNQLSLTCAYPKDSVPCERMKDYFNRDDFHVYSRPPAIAELLAIAKRKEQETTDERGFPRVQVIAIPTPPKSDEPTKFPIVRQPPAGIGPSYGAGRNNFPGSTSERPKLRHQDK